MATTSRTGMTILGLVGVAVLGVGGTVLAAGGMHHDDSDYRDHMGGWMMGGSMMGDADEWADHDRMMSDAEWADHGPMMGMMGGSMMGDADEWADHDRMMSDADEWASRMPSWMWEEMWEHMGLSPSDTDEDAAAADEPTSGASVNEKETPIEASATSADSGVSA